MNIQFLLGIIFGIFLSTELFLINKCVKGFSSGKIKLKWELFSIYKCVKGLGSGKIKFKWESSFILNLLNLAFNLSVVLVICFGIKDLSTKFAWLVTWIILNIIIFFITKNLKFENKTSRASFYFVVSIMYILPIIYIMNSTTSRSYSKVIHRKDGYYIENAPDYTTLAVFMGSIAFSVIITLLTYKEND
ncbi:hypothetical protein [Rummeliibacillus stabekisii]|uniref:hypothetical protein n=1 Tax=Rummeliibacillus stabekisii TaxID=241244 RepID=UPI00116E2DA3|nr:hypothetical protein [Rummeliibacillus stabekisii]MBB5171543.1 hypothetical protein [Rummeliibacillus stabekisii]GEL05510.1 hypothetical protein RST01_21370 [Rummeliibacillus stabekisii]